MRILAVITARGGSKRLPGKNGRMLAGRPLIAWSVEVATGIPELCDILVSTDDPTIARLARAAGATVPWLRPAHLATDSATSADACIHALDWYEGIHGVVDGLLLLQPTSPFRRRESVIAGIRCFQEAGGRPVVGVCPAGIDPSRYYVVRDGGLTRLLASGSTEASRGAAVVANGALYLITPAQLRDVRTFYPDDMVPLVMADPVESIDIDTPWDWAVAEAVAASRLLNGSVNAG